MMSMPGHAGILHHILHRLHHRITAGLATVVEEHRQRVLAANGRLLLHVEQHHMVTTLLEDALAIVQGEILQRTHFHHAVVHHHVVQLDALTDVRHLGTLQVDRRARVHEGHIGPRHVLARYHFLNHAIFQRGVRSSLGSGRRTRKQHRRSSQQGSNGKHHGFFHGKTPPGETNGNSPAYTSASRSHHNLGLRTQSLSQPRQHTGKRDTTLNNRPAHRHAVTTRAHRAITQPWRDGPPCAPVRPRRRT